MKIEVELQIKRMDYLLSFYCKLITAHPTHKLFYEFMKLCELFLAGGLPPPRPAPTVFIFGTAAPRLPYRENFSSWHVIAKSIVN